MHVPCIFHFTQSPSLHTARSRICIQSCIQSYTSGQIRAAGPSSKREFAKYKKHFLVSHDMRSLNNAWKRSLSYLSSRVMVNLVFFCPVYTFYIADWGLYGEGTPKVMKDTGRTVQNWSRHMDFVTTRTTRKTDTKDSGKRQENI